MVISVDVETLTMIRGIFIDCTVLFSLAIVIHGSLRK